jgi:osmoprotectant transport system ATP-binding protein
LIRFERVSKVFPGGLRAVCDLSLEVAQGETLVLLGTSGSGKTTSMKMVNRLIEPSSGRVLVQGEDVMHTDPIQLRRKIGYAIQHIGLFSHMTVAQNIGVVPRLLGWARDRIDERIGELLATVGLEPGAFRDRYPSQLSGGQEQRVGVARALAADPPIVLMDEPFGALDPITREQLQNEFLQLESEIKKTVVFVTHDVFEAVKMGDRIALLDAGRLEQLDTPSQLVEEPATPFVDQFLGQHRFQLSMLTRTVGSILPPGETEAPLTAPPERSTTARTGAKPATHKELQTSAHGAEKLRCEALKAHDSLVAGLDRFKQTLASELPVYEGERFVGTLTRQQLLDEITDALAETGEKP